MKYYLATGLNFNDPTIQTASIAFKFELMSFFSGSWWGAYKTENPEEIAALDKVAGSQGVKHLSEKDYGILLKKKNPTHPNIQVFTEAVPDKRPNPSRFTPEQDARHVAADDDLVPESPASAEQEHKLENLLETRDRTVAVEGVVHYVKSTAKLAEILDISISSINRELKRGAPSKTDDGYSIAAWNAHLAK